MILSCERYKRVIKNLCFKQTLIKIQYGGGLSLKVLEINRRILRFQNNKWNRRRREGYIVSGG